MVLKGAHPHFQVSFASFANSVLFCIKYTIIWYIQGDGSEENLELNHLISVKEWQ